MQKQYSHTPLLTSYNPYSTRADRAPRGSTLPSTSTSTRSRGRQRVAHIDSITSTTSSTPCRRRKRIHLLQQRRVHLLRLPFITTATTTATTPSRLPRPCGPIPTYLVRHCRYPIVRLPVIRVRVVVPRSTCTLVITANRTACTTSTSTSTPRC